MKGIAGVLVHATVAAFIVMIFIFAIKKASAKYHIPLVSTIADGV